ncbi:MAG: hypothetical protein Q4E12_05145 [Coriobacteriia bacterium]|nr:hypothetical protein [Coriobacteriia bacterium]
MQADEATIATLEELQQLDLHYLRAKKQFDQLPQRQTILQVRKQRAAVEEKREKVAAAKAELDQKLSKIMQEDENLQEKQAEIQKAIDDAGNDYRNLEARTKELDGAQRRRSALAEQMEDLDAQLSKVMQMEAQVNTMLSQLQATEDEAVNSFREEGGTLQAEMRDLSKQRADMALSLSQDVLALYEKTARACGGVAIGRLNGTKCGACRTTFDDARLLNVKSQAPLAICPTCKRLLIVS